MRRLLVAVLVAAFATTACTDSASHSLTEPSFRNAVITGSEYPNLSSGQIALWNEIEEALNTLYACATDPKQVANKNSDLEKVAKYANSGWWTSGPKANENVAYMVNKLITNTLGLMTNKAQTLPATCTDSYENATERQALYNHVKFLLETFAANNLPTDPDTEIVGCQFTQDCEEVGGGWKVDIPANTFNENVIVVIRKNNGNSPQGLNPVGQSFHFDLVPANAQANNPWTRYICWAGDFPDDNESDPPVSWIVMVRETGNPDEPLEFLPTVAEFWPGVTCASPNQEAGNALVRGAKRFFAGLPFFPTNLDAYNPPRSFGGAGLAASPHWLTVVVPVPGCDLACLTAKADDYYGDATPNKNAAMGKLAAAAACAADDDDCWNSALLGFMANVKAQTQPPSNKILTADEGAELMGNALALMR